MLQPTVALACVGHVSVRSCRQHPAVCERGCRLLQPAWTSGRQARCMRNVLRQPNSRFLPRHARSLPLLVPSTTGAGRLLRTAGCAANRLDTGQVRAASPRNQSGVSLVTWTALAVSKLPSPIPLSSLLARQKVFFVLSNMVGMVRIPGTDEWLSRELN